MFLQLAYRDRTRPSSSSEAKEYVVYCRHEGCSWKFNALFILPNKLFISTCTYRGGCYIIDIAGPSHLETSSHGENSSQSLACYTGSYFPRVRSVVSTHSSRLASSNEKPLNNNKRRKANKLVSQRKRLADMASLRWRNDPADSVSFKLLFNF